MKAHAKSLILLALAAVLAGSPAASAAPYKPVRTKQVMVASNHAIASRVGADILKQGGNGVDAAVATAFALAVVYPEAGNIGGGGFLLVRFADGKSSFVDFREKAPAAATKDMYLDATGKPVKDLSSVGYKAIGVPGSVAGLYYAHKKWGKLKWDKVVQPAIYLAKIGFALEYDDEEAFKAERMAKFKESRRVFQRNGDFYRAGEMFRQPDLARTLERIAAKPLDFYQGSLAKEFANAIQKGGGIITDKDMAAYEVKEREPLVGTYRGYTIITAPPPSSGGIALLETLNMLEGFDIGHMGHQSGETIHLVSEAFRRAMFDRMELLGDPDFVKVPVATLVDKKYATQWRSSIGNQASESRSLKRPAELVATADSSVTSSTRREPQDTTHLSVVDAQGNAVALTTTINDLFGSGVTVDGLGFLTNNEMDDFTTAPNTPNSMGIIQGKQNNVEPGKRPLSSMTPTIVLDPNGKLFLVTGARGGPRIITTVTNIVIGMIDFKLNVQEAVNAARFHHQFLPDSIRMERTGFSHDTIKVLSEKGHRLDFTTYWSGSESIGIDPKTGDKLGGSDARYYGKVAGY